MFKERLVLAKAQVEQPTQPTLKLKMNASQAKNPSLKLKFGSAKASPAAPSPGATPGADRNTPGLIVHDDALERQRQMVAVGMNGGHASTSGASAGPRNPFGGASRSGSASTPIPNLNSHGAGGSPPAHLNGVKSEMHPGQSPALSAIRPSHGASGSIGHMHQQGQAHRISSGSPHPPLQPSLYSTNSNNNHHYQPPQHHHTNGFFENRTRPAGQSKLYRHVCLYVTDYESTAAADSILPSLTFATHPALSLSKPMNLTIPAHSSNTQQSVTVTVPSTHYYFQITPHVPVGLTNRPYRLFVVVNGQRVSEYTKPGTERVKDRPLFEARLEKGMVNRIEVEVLAGKVNATKGGKEEVELEKCTLYVHVLRT
jgi:hypothetical protein